MIDTPNKDPLGQALKAYQAGLSTAEIQVVSDIAIDDVIPVEYLFRTEQDMPKWELTALDLCRGKVLDIGAGAGCHSLALQNRGHEVVALEISTGAVDIMTQSGIRHVEHGSLWDYQGGPYDTLLLMMNGIGLVGDFQGLRRRRGRRCTGNFNWRS
ncbi:hypothetical protein [Pontibacter sp. G13]|uniref:class I SAM-dependent methyltransferase n=1 Tax=Pontibacter sp. G13 TaxID=3074898 RepID=UPI00288AB07F|nr:hypothetical protein [Pontibacter sp. G13]WNJ16205.1 hypothetical protein RJD25_15180 [Pontibacter sp. G13]